MTSNHFASNKFLFGCSFYENTKDCPFAQLRQLAIEERIYLLKKMTFQEINNLEFVHNKCLALNKENI